MQKDVRINNQPKSKRSSSTIVKVGANLSGKLDGIFI